MTNAAKLDWLTETVGIRTLPDRAIIEVSGDDAHEWLQGQLTNQLDELEPGGSVYAFVLTLKGRVLADVWVLVRDECFWLDVPAAQVDALLARFDRYIIMEDVTLTYRPELRVIVAVGPRSGEVAEGAWPSARLGITGREWVVPDSDLGTDLERLEGRAQALDGGSVDDDQWSAAHVLRGRPRFGVDFGESTYPQETGLTPLAVSFTKGCYIGQETVVMLENRGKPPKVLWRWRVQGASRPTAHTPIERGGSKVGEVTSATEAGGSVIALGFLKRGEDGSGEFAIGNANAEALGPVQQGPGVEGDDT
jgi:folate-binding protein YgfZ